MPQTILVVDDDPQIARLVREYLEQAGYHVLMAYDGNTAIHNVYQNKPDLVILDLGLPDRDGWDVTRIIRNDERVATIPIIMLTARVDDSDKIVGLELGADDYIPKPFNAREVVARVRALLRRQEWDQKPSIRAIQHGNLRLDPATHELRVSGRLVDLTPAEFKLLQTLMENPRITFHREELLEKALGYGYEGLGRTLDTHIKNLRQKVEPDPKNPTYIQTVYRVGYRFIIPEMEAGTA